MKKLIPILAVFLILSTLLVSCGKIEKYHDTPKDVYLAVPYVDPAEWRNYRYLKEELGTIELDSNTLLWIAVCSAVEDSGYFETIIVKEVKKENGKYTFGNFTYSFDPNTINSQKQFTAKDMLNEEFNGKTLVFDVWNTEKLGEKTNEYQYKDFNINTKETTCNFTVIYRIGE